MTKTKKQLRAEAVERLKSTAHWLICFYSDGETVRWYSNEPCDRESVGMAMLKDIELLTNDIAELEAERDQWRDAYGDSERMRLRIIADLDHARKWNDTWRDLVRRYEGLCDELLDERDALRGELP